MGPWQKEESIRFHHGDDPNFLFGITCTIIPTKGFPGRLICFHQPVFGDHYSFPDGAQSCLRCIITRPGLWARIILRSLSTKKSATAAGNLPHMSVNMYQEQPRPIILGSDSSIKNITAPYAFRSWHSFQNQDTERGINHGYQTKQ